MAAATVTVDFVAKRSAAPGRADNIFMAVVMRMPHASYNCWIVTDHPARVLAAPEADIKLL